jgi:hypothetical protein
VDVSRHASIGDPNIERTLQTEANDRVPRNPHGSTAKLATTDGSNDCTDEEFTDLVEVVRPRFNTVGICFDGIAHAVRDNRFKVEDQVLIAIWISLNVGLRKLKHVHLRLSRDGGLRPDRRGPRSLTRRRQRGSPSGE